MAPKKSTENGVEDSTGSSDEDTDFCDRDSVASSVDSTAEEMFMDGLDSILDQSSTQLRLLYLAWFVTSPGVGSTARMSSVTKTTPKWPYDFLSFMKY
ncbi:hypothetical protein DPX16_14200 [Anabarilius grahami]|uniref:Uncharacterized protein n=1 Tax=Anabarilius grahami TaxID=495550 RepID=A0A3N0XF82_ANAGA|nr:hypothetical protein DPX16_14200 [Anabarilius grahami]